MRVRFRSPWWVAAGAVAGLFVCNGPVLGFTFGVFLKPIMASMGWDRGTASFALSFGGVVSALTVPVIGRLMDRFSIRKVALPGIVVYATLLALVGLSPKSLLLFTLFFALAGGASEIQSPIGYAKAITAWFDRRRGLALGIAMSGVGLGGFVMPQLATWLIGRVGWRGTYPSLALLTLLIAWPVVALWIREPRPGEGERQAPTPAPGLPGLEVRQALATTRFWMLAAAFFLVAIGIQGAVGHVVPLLTDHGFTPARAAAMMGVFGLATMCGRLLAGWLVDRIFAPYVATVLWLSPIAGFVFLENATGFWPAIGIVLLGLGLGTEIDLIAFLNSRYLGQRRFGELYGYFFMVFVIGSSLAKILLGLVYDLAGGYGPALVGAALALLVAAALVLQLGPYVYPVEHTPTADLAAEPAAS
jgi:predicted MFS family arabinose efflux permease